MYKYLIDDKLDKTVGWFQCRPNCRGTETLRVITKQKLFIKQLHSFSTDVFPLGIFVGAVNVEDLEIAHCFQKSLIVLLAP